MPSKGSRPARECGFYLTLWRVSGRIGAVPDVGEDAEGALAASSFFDSVCV